MAKYIRIMFYLIAVLFTGNVLAQTILDGEIVESASFKSAKERQRQLQCMAQNVYWEAGNEPHEGKIAVAQVVMNRVESGQFPKDPCAVVQQKSVFMEKVVCQFSWYCESSRMRILVNSERWQESQEVAKLVLLDGFRLNLVKDALYFHAVHVNPRWGKRKVAKIGNHIFYNNERARSRS
jgi:spore germination cell wall hydrolase CwlJ-like protein